MTYTDDLPLSTIERDAWQRGDALLAQVAAVAQDNAQYHTEATDEAESLKSVVDAIRERITEANWRTGKKAELRELVEAIVNELAEG